MSATNKFGQFLQIALLGLLIFPLQIDPEFHAANWEIRFFVRQRFVDVVCRFIQLRILHRHQSHGIGHAHVAGRGLLGTLIDFLRLGVPFR